MPHATRVAEGYSMDVIAAAMAKALPGVPIEINVTADNVAILGSDVGLLSTRCNFVVNPQTLCIGAAAISITAAREAAGVDFLTSYFTSGLRVMTRLKVDAFTTVVQILTNSGTLALGAIVVVAIFLLIMAPIVWATEMLGFKEGQVPIFMPSLTHRGRSKEVKSTSLVLMQSFKNALQWTFSTFMGAELALPHSKIAKNTLYPLIKLFATVVLVVGTAAAAAIFTIDASSASTIGGIKDLPTDTKVCTNDASTPIRNFVEDNSYRFGYRVVHTQSSRLMLDAYWAGECQAVIYDAPLLDYEVASKGMVGVHGLVGDLLKFDPYGFAIPNDHPLFEKVNQALIEVVTNPTIINPIKATWLDLPQVENTRMGLGTLSTWTPFFGYLAQAIAAVIVLALLALYLKRNRIGLLVGNVRATITEASSNNMRAARKNILDKGAADIALTPTGELVHEMAFELHQMHYAIAQLLAAAPQNDLFTPRETPRGAGAPLGTTLPIGGSVDPFVKIRKLKELLDAGAISKEQCEKSTQELLLKV